MKSGNVSIAILLAVFLLILGAHACKKDNEGSSGGSGTSKVEMRLTDDPSAQMYDAIYLNIKHIEVNVKGGWIVLTPSRPGYYDILKLRNGLDTLLGEFDLPAGRINQIRLILDAGSYIVVDGMNYQLNTPSAEESGLKLNIHEDFIAGRSYEVWLDFDAVHSIHQTGNGSYMLTPVIRAYTADTNGKINGYVFPDSANIVVYAIIGSDSIAAIPNSNGYFAISGLEEGSYQLFVDAQNERYHDQIKSNVQVHFGVTTTIETITLIPQ